MDAAVLVDPQDEGTVAGVQLEVWACVVGAAQAGKRPVVDLVPALEEMVAEAGTVVEGRARECQAAACTEAEEPLEREACTQQGWARDGQVWVQA